MTRQELQNEYGQLALLQVELEYKLDNIKERLKEVLILIEATKITEQIKESHEQTDTD